MPRSVLLIRNALALVFGVAGAWFVWRALQLESWGPWIPAALYLAASVGLWRGVVWGRFVSSCATVVTAFALPNVFLGEDRPDGTSPFLNLFGFDLPIWFEVLLIVFAAVALLSPLVVIGWRRDYFRRALW